MQGNTSTLSPPVTRRPSHPSGIDPISPPVDPGGGGTGWIQIACAKNDIEAHLLTGRLAEAGIETRCLKDRTVPGAWMHGGSNPWAPVAVYVMKLQAEDAQLVMAEISWAQPAVDPTTTADHSDGGKRYALKWWFAAITLGLLLTSIALARTGEALNNCELPLICAETSGPPGD
jgi:hypothetical protein